MLKARSKQRTDSTHILAVVRGINRLECVLESMRFALNAIAKESPEWLNQMWKKNGYVVIMCAAVMREFRTRQSVGRSSLKWLDMMPTRCLMRFIIGLIC